MTALAVNSKSGSEQEPKVLSDT